MCGKCYVKLVCFVYYCFVDNGDGEISGMNEKFDELVKYFIF